MQSLTATVNGQAVTLDNNGIGSAQVTQPGFINVSATATDVNGLVSTATTRVRVIDPTDTTAPEVEILSPGNLEVITNLTDIVANVTSDGDLDTYRVEYSLTGTETWVLLAEGTRDVAGETVAVFDPTLLANNSYDIRITASDFSGNTFKIAHSVIVEAQTKLGNYAISLTDLSIPLAGIPITITRQYDTLNANVSQDFGFGTRLAIGEADLRESVPVGEAELAGVPTLFGGSRGLAFGDRVFITTPEGQRVAFTFEPTAVGGLIGGIFTPRFVSNDTDYTLEVENLPMSQLPDGTFGVNLFRFPYNPSEYTLVSRDQIRYNYDQFDGLQSVEDRNGVRLDYRDDGIFSTTGEAITWTRDDFGRITEIVDPAGNVLRYDYSDAGDLIRFTDHVGNVTTLEYSTQRAHFLERIIGPRGNIVNEVRYDEDGRFVAVGMCQRH